MIVTGIGSRKIDATQYNIILSIARYLRRKGWFLRSGGAVGADSAWEEAWVGSDQKLILLPHEGFNKRPRNDACYPHPKYDELWFEAEDIARNLHNRFDQLDEFSRTAHTRNVYQVLGERLCVRSDLVVACAKPNGRSVHGGTATAFNLAKGKGIPTFNIWLVDQRQQLLNHLEEKYSYVTYRHPRQNSNTSDDLFEDCVEKSCSY